MGSCCSGALISIMITLIKPDNKFDWSETKKINPRGRALDQDRADQMQTTSQVIDVPLSAVDSEKGSGKAEAVNRTSSLKEASFEEQPENYQELEKSLKVATWLSLIMSFIIVFVRFMPSSIVLAVTELDTAHSDPNVPFALRLFSALFQGLGDHMCGMALHCGFYHFHSACLGKSQGHAGNL